MVRISSFIIGIFVACAGTLASTSTGELWTSVTFSTRERDQISIYLDNNGALKKMDVSLNQHRVNFPKESLKGFGVPVLQGTQLLRSFALKKGKIYETTELTFPVLDRNKESQSLENLNVVSFVIQDYRVTRRDIWKNKKRQKLINSVVYIAKESN
jgi:hypothetical protein